MERSAGNGVRSFGDLVYLALDNDDERFNSLNSFLDSPSQKAKFFFGLAVSGAILDIGLSLIADETVIAIPIGVVLAHKGWVRFKNYVNKVANTAYYEMNKSTEELYN
jgi:hypothetical protein